MRATTSVYEILRLWAWRRHWVVPVAHQTSSAFVLFVLFTVEDQYGKTDGVRYLGAFFAGAILSATAGWCGMMVATDGNTRTTAACAGK